MANAKEKTEWPKLDDGGESATSGSSSSKTFNDELTAAYTTFTEEAIKGKLSEAQISTLTKYCFIPLQPDQHGDYQLEYIIW